MLRPLRLPVWARVSATRVEPIAGTEDAGYAYGDKPAAKHWNWMRGVAGDWFDWQDRTALNTKDLFTSYSPNRVSPTALAFTLGGPLNQRPVTGGVYYVRRERADMSSITAPPAGNCPLYVFAPSATNYVWVRPRLDTSRSGYPEMVINQTGLEPNGETSWACVYQNTTNLATVVTQQEHVSVQAGHYYGNGVLAITMTAGVAIAPAATWDAATLSIQTRQQTSGFPAIIVSPDVGMSVTQLYIGSNVNQTSLAMQALGSVGYSTPGIDVYTDTGGAALKVTGNGSDDAALYANMGATGWVIAAEKATVTQVPHDPAGEHANQFRMYISQAQTIAAGVRWLDGTGGGKEWIPWASPQGPVLEYSQYADSLGHAGGANVNIINEANLHWRQFHRYDIRISAEALAAAGAVNTIAVTILVNGVVQGGWNAKQLRVAADGFNHPWLHTSFVYTHAGADTNTGTLVVQVVVGAGVGVNGFLAPRVTTSGAYYP